MWHLGKSDYQQYATVWEVEDHDTYATVKLGTSRKDKKTDSYLNSNWSFVKFVGNAYPSILEVSPKTKIIIKSGGISQEPYVNKEGVRAWPKNPQTVVFAWDYPEDTDSPRHSSIDNNPKMDNSEDTEDMPF
jgi:hypothetical protein